MSKKYNESQWQLIRKRFCRHKIALAAFFRIQTMYVAAIFADFFAPYGANTKNLDYTYCPPQLPRISLSQGLHTYAMIRHVDPVTLAKIYTEEKSTKIPLGFFVKGDEYKLLGIFPCKTHFFGVKQYQKNNSGNQVFYMLGTDTYGRDILSRILYGSRISLSIGIVAIAVTFTLGVSIGGLSGYLGGNIDNFIQRTIEIINSIPKLPLWLAFGAIMPDEWSPLQIYFAITIVLSLLGWTRLARVVRGKMLSLREEDYAVAAQLLGAGHARILFKHLLPGFTSHIIVSLTMTIPWMILGETTLSFLGVGLRSPVVSWGVMLQDCINMTIVANYPWLLLPAVMIIVTVLSFNFLGDGLRDAADPYAEK